MKTISIIGAGPGLGLSLAKRFGESGFKVAVVSRNSEKLADIVSELKKLNIEAYSFVADVTDLTSLKDALHNIKNTMGSIDVIEFSPYAGLHTYTHVLETTPESVMEHISSYLLPAILCVNEVLPDMIKKGSGALLFTTGISAMFPVPIVGNAGIIMSGIRNYVTNLHNELKEKGIFVGHLSIGTMIQAGTEGDPDKIAHTWYSIYEEQDRFEEIFPIGLNPAATFKK